MLKIQPVIDYIEDTYDFKFVPCSIPRNDFQYSKRNLYIFILRKVSKKFFYFLKKVSPIKYIKERPDGRLWYQKRGEDGRVSVELEIVPLPPEVFMYATDTTQSFKISLKYQNYKFTIYTTINGFSSVTTFPFNYNCDEQMINNHFSKIDELKRELRHKRLSELV